MHASVSGLLILLHRPICAHPTTIVKFFLMLVFGQVFCSPSKLFLLSLHFHMTLEITFNLNII